VGAAGKSVPFDMVEGEAALAGCTNRTTRLQPPEIPGMKQGRKRDG